MRKRNPRRGRRATLGVFPTDVISPIPADFNLTENQVKIEEIAQKRRKRSLDKFANMGLTGSNSSGEIEYNQNNPMHRRWLNE